MWERVQGQLKALENLYHSPLYPLKLKATHKEALIKAVSLTEYNERMNYGAMATRSSSSSSCCSDERKLTWYRRKARQVWSADRPCVHISGNLCDENEPLGFWHFHPHGWDLLDLSVWGRSGHGTTVRQLDSVLTWAGCRAQTWTALLSCSDTQRGCWRSASSAWLWPRSETFTNTGLAIQMCYKKGLILSLEAAILHREYSR